MMYGNNWNYTPNLMFGNWVGAMGASFAFLLVPLLVWSLFWKGWALWRAAKEDSMPWFIALLVVNTAGILEILYIFVFSKMKKVSRSRSRK